MLSWTGSIIIEESIESSGSHNVLTSSSQERGYWSVTEHCQGVNTKYFPIISYLLPFGEFSVQLLMKMDHQFNKGKVKTLSEESFIFCLKKNLTMDISVP